jgi:hypothetical protein
MTTTNNTIQDPDLARVEAALQRAAQKARKTAKDTRTPLIIYKDGKIRRYRVGKAKSVGMTEQGFQKSEKLFKKFFMGN